MNKDGNVSEIFRVIFDCGYHTPLGDGVEFQEQDDETEMQLGTLYLW